MILIPLSSAQIGYNYSMVIDCDSASRWNLIIIAPSTTNPTGAASEWYPPTNYVPQLDTTNFVQGSASLYGVLEAKNGVNEGYLAYSLPYSAAGHSLDWSTNTHILSFAASYSPAPSYPVQPVIVIGTQDGSMFWYWFSPTATLTTYEIDLLHPSNYNYNPDVYVNTSTSLRGVSTFEIGFICLGPSASLLSDLTIHIDNVEIGYLSGSTPVPTLPPVIPNSTPTPYNPLSTPTPYLYSTPTPQGVNNNQAPNSPVILGIQWTIQNTLTVIVSVAIIFACATYVSYSQGKHKGRKKHK